MSSVPCMIPLAADKILEDIEFRLNSRDNKQCKNLISNQICSCCPINVCLCVCYPVSDEDLLSLHSVFGIVLQRAFDILEKHPTLVAYHTAKKTRILIEIKGEKGHCYRVFPRINYCPCLAFKHQVLERKSQVFCKHVLAARVAQMLNQLTYHEVTHDQYLMLLNSMFDLEDNNG